MEKTICCAIGHRPNGFPWNYRDINDARYMEYKESMACYIDLYIRKHRSNYFICGGAIGVDMDFAETVIDIRDNVYDDICLEIAAPCRYQDKKWAAKDKERYRKLLCNADIVTYVSEDYSMDCMMKRNKYMVDKSDIIFAFWNRNKTDGGTFGTIQYAKNQGKPLEMFILNDY